jgi:hypothetical protein
VQPVLVIGGLIIDQTKIHALTHDFLALKRRYFPALLPVTDPYLHWVLPEIKGADLRRQLRGNRDERRHATGFLDRLFELLRTHDARLIGRVWVKQPAAPFDGRAVYTSSVQAIYGYFQHYLQAADRRGIVVLDSRTKNLNTQVSFSVFTEKFRTAGDRYPRIIEMPTFGHSDNHAGLQLMDAIVSTVLYPMATLTYCTGHVQSVHVEPRLAPVKQRFAPLVRDLQYRFQDETGRWRGGVVVHDAIAQKSGAELFR